jgi:hypothetical protein
MRPVRVVLVVAVVVAAVAGQSFAAAVKGAKVSKGASAPKAASVGWFSGESSQGLEQDRRGNLLASGQPLPVRKRVRGLYAAAYYPGAGVLVTVDGKAVARLYERKGTRLELSIFPVSVRFSRIPGLVYLIWSYPEPRMAAQLQTSWRHAERLALGSSANGWHAVTTEDPRAKLLDYAYQVPSRTSVRLLMPDAKRIALQLPAPLASWRPGQDTDFDREPVTVIPGQSIVCQTTAGWSLHSMGGRLVYAIVLPASEKRTHTLGHWHEPFYHHGQFYVAEVVPSLSYYRLDFAQGKMVRLKGDLPGEQPHRAH